MDKTTIQYEELKEEFPYLKNNSINRGQLVVLMVVHDIQSEYGAQGHAYRDEILRKAGQYYSDKYIYSVITTLRDKGILDHNEPRFSLREGDYEHVQEVRSLLNSLSDNEQDDDEQDDVVDLTWSDVFETFQRYYWPL